jgi:hypothetical protein
MPNRPGDERIAGQRLHQGAGDGQIRPDQGGKHGARKPGRPDNDMFV